VRDKVLPRVPTFRNSYNLILRRVHEILMNREFLLIRKFSEESFCFYIAEFVLYSRNINTVIQYDIRRKPAQLAAICIFPGYIQHLRWIMKVLCLRNLHYYHSFLPPQQSSKMGYCYGSEYNIAARIMHAS
jgi:hypothetical protein